MSTHCKTTTRSRLGLEALEERMVLASSMAAPLLDPSLVSASAPAAPMQVHYQNSDTVSLASVPNDPNFSKMWGLRNTGQDGGTSGVDIKATAAWSVTKGSTRTIVSVMDTGIDYTAPDLYLNIWINQGEIPPAIRSRLIDTDGDGLITFRDLNDKRNQGAGKITDLDHDGRITGADILKPVSQGGWADGIDNSKDGYVDDLIGWNFADNNNNPMDTNSHGTHVAGTIGAIGNNGVGVTGVDWNVQLMPVKFISSDSASVTAFIQGLHYAIDHGSHISNNSWVGNGNSTVLQDAIDEARAAGHIMVCAAGNAGTNNDADPNFPASYPEDNILSVAAIDADGRLASYSNYGSRSVDIAAPGSNILSTLPGGTYGTKSGTSMATPHVTGVVALVWSQHPNWTYRQVIAQVESTATRTAALSGKVKTGQVDAAAAVGAVQVTATAPIIVNAVNLGNSTRNLSTIRVSFDRSMVPSTFTASDVVLTGPDGKAIRINGVAAVAGYGNNVYDISFANQTRGGNYTVKIGPDVKDASGTQMTTYQKTFSLASQGTPPAIVNAVSMGNASNLSTIRVSFNHPVNASTFTASDVVLTGPDGKAIAVSKVGVASGYGSNVFDISFANQTKGGNYTVKVGPGISDSTGASMASTYQKTFSLASQGPPPAIVNAVSLGNSSSLSGIRVSFDRLVIASTFTASDVALTGPDGKAIAVSKVGVASGYGSNVFDISFANQTKGGNYTVKVGPGISSSSGVSMASTYQKTFSLASQGPPPAIVNAVSMGNASNLSTIRISFNHPVNASTFTASDVVLTGPDGKAIAVSKVGVASGYGSNVFDISFANQTRGGNYTVKVGPGISDSTGVSMASTYQKTFSLASQQPPVIGTPSQPMTSYVAQTDVNIVPRGRGVSLLNVNKSGTIGHVSVEFNIQHPHVADLYVTLQAPDGTTVVLVNQAGGNAANFLDTVLDDNAGRAIGTNQSPVFGTFTPATPLSALNGKSMAGTWKLWVQDRAGLRSGVLTEWSLLITPR